VVSVVSVVRMVGVARPVGVVVGIGRGSTHVTPPPWRPGLL
jgi:hypothetical protein